MVETVTLNCVIANNYLGQIIVFHLFMLLSICCDIDLHNLFDASEKKVSLPLNLLFKPQFSTN